MKKTVLSMFVISLFALMLSGCGSSVDNSVSPDLPNVLDDSRNMDNSTATDVGGMTCYEECEMYGGGEENLKMCKENCDASYKRNEIEEKQEMDVEIMANEQDTCRETCYNAIVDGYVKDTEGKVDLNECLEICEESFIKCEDMIQKGETTRDLFGFCTDGHLIAEIYQRYPELKK